jgi:RNA polymerase sigma-70 factor (ECF subfamily)
VKPDLPPPDKPSDDDLMREVRTGSSGAFRALVERYQGRAWRVALRYAGDEGQAEDLVQETFLRVLQSAPRYQPRGQFAAFLFRILANLAISWKRPAARLVPDDNPERHPAAETPESSLEKSSTERAVREALATLPPAQRLALVFRYYEDLSYEEMAPLLDTTPKGVERLLSRGREALRTRIRS